MDWFEVEDWLEVDWLEVDCLEVEDCLEVDCLEKEEEGQKGKGWKRLRGGGEGWTWGFGRGVMGRRRWGWRGEHGQYSKWRGQ